jgi:LCP family protein required for cell wall assembly
MTDWPDDWFRKPAAGAGGGGAADGAGDPGGAGAEYLRGGTEPPTVEGVARPSQSAGAQGGVDPAFGATAPAGRHLAADQLTVPGTAGAAYSPHQPGMGGGVGAPGGSAGAGAGWPEQPALRTSGRQARSAWPGGFGLPTGPRLTGWRRWLRPRVIVAAVAALICAILIIAIGGYFFLDSRLTKIDALSASAPTAGQNWLITGSTGKLNRSLIVRLHTGFDFDNLSDTIMVLHIPANGGRPTLVSIPRDSYVPIPGKGWNKINAAYAFGGPALMVRTVQQDTGLHINHYLGIGYDGLVNVVNAVGGIRLCLPGAVNDPKAGIRLPKGCDKLNGRQALGFVRTRQFAVGDLQRVQDQRVMMKALLKKMTSVGTALNPFAIIPAAVGSADAVTVDKGTSLLQLVHVAFALKNPVTTTVPFGGFATNAAGDVVLWNTSQARQLFHDLATDQRVPRRLITGSKLVPTV